MTGDDAVDLSRSRQELAAATLLAQNGFPAQAVSRADYDAESVPEAEGSRAISDAAVVVDTVSAWLTRLGP